MTVSRAEKVFKVTYPLTEEENQIFPRNLSKPCPLKWLETRQDISYIIKALSSPLNSISHTASGTFSSITTRRVVGNHTNSLTKNTTSTSQTPKSLIEVSGDLSIMMTLTKVTLKTIKV